ncbi:hypothetical protein Q5P01_017941 [Channa striata]|uniref:Mucin-1 n=1 Tax=Channa striata TaxID=64152 RepID=A0AA88M3W1_CHASR|nr:hypothetical protein Q5P01_017941 [Channa striata]
MKWLRTNILCFLTISGLLTGQSVPLPDLLSVEQDSDIQQKAFYLPIEITNRPFTNALLNPASEEYQTMYNEVSYLLSGIYNCLDINQCPTNRFYGGVSTMTFSPGSVIANATVIFNTMSINPSIIHIYFVINANTVQPQTLQLNLDYTTSKTHSVTHSSSSCPSSVINVSACSYNHYHNHDSTNYNHKNTNYDHDNTNYDHDNTNYDHDNTNYDHDNTIYNHKNTNYNHDNTNYNHDNTNYNHDNTNYDHDNTNYDHDNTNYNHDNTNYNHKNTNYNHDNTNYNHDNTNYNNDNTNYNHDNTNYNNDNTNYNNDNTNYNHDNTNYNNDNTDNTNFNHKNTNT